MCVAARWVARWVGLWVGCGLFELRVQDMTTQQVLARYATVSRAMRSLRMDRQCQDAV